MANISVTDAQGLFTKALVDVYKERPKPTGFLRSFFPSVESATKEVSIEVQRGTEKTAVDVVRGTEGNRNTFSKSTEKIFIPPFYREYMELTEIHLYDRLYGATQINDGIFAQYINNVADNLMDLQAKIERSYEKQCAEVLELGTVTLNAATSIDYKRKSGSKVDLGGGNYWATGTNDPFATFDAGMTNLSKTGKITTGVGRAILGETALRDLMANTKFQARQDLVNMKLDSVSEPLMSAEGAVYHGTVTAGAYRVELWSYPQYHDVAGVSTPYVNAKKVILMPANTRFKLSFAAVPQLITPNSLPTKGAYVFGEYKDERLTSHIMDIKSAGLAIPVAVDQIYTVQVVA
jgi:hypothetical protein